MKNNKKASNNDYGVGKAKKMNLRMSARKIRLLADEVRGLSVNDAVGILSFSKHKMAVELKKLIKSAASNFVASNRSTNQNALFVSTLMVDQGYSIKRIMTRARGSAAGILKRTSHITVMVADKGESKGR